MYKIGIIGYGNLAKGLESSLNASPDMRLTTVFSRRADLNINTPAAKVEPMDRLVSYVGQLDAVVCCGGSATDLPKQTPLVASMFNFVDSFDTHVDIPRHFEAVDTAARKAGTVGVISAGWDPGLFSIQRLLGESILPDGDTYTFWGKGVSQGHSDAVRRIPGVINAVQYTVPFLNAMSQVRKGLRPELSTRQKHKRVCFVVAEPGMDKMKIKEEIINMPGYFLDYDTSVYFISREKFMLRHTKMPHGGKVFRTGTTSIDAATGIKTNQVMEFSLKLDSNPEFTGSVLAAYTRAVVRLSKEGAKGARTVLDIPPSYLSHKPAMQLYKELL